MTPQEESEKLKRMQIVEAFAEIVCEKRKDAIEARSSSGIETIWQEDQDAYDGKDGNAVVTSKGRTANDSLKDVSAQSSTRSTVVLKITRPYVDAASARVSDMLLPTDDRNFGLRPTPVTDAQVDQTTQPPSQLTPVMGAVNGFMGMPPQAPVVDDKKTTERALQVIDDYLIECRYHAEVRKVIESAAKLGTGILKGPVPVQVKHRKAKKTEEGWTVEMVEKIMPQSKFVSLWNFYPDGSCGTDIQRGSYVFEADDITARKLMDLKADPTYIAEMIDMCIEEGPTSPTDGTRKRAEGAKTKEKDLFQIWYGHLQVTKKDMEAAGCVCRDGKELYPAVVTMVNDRIIKITMSALDSGEFPYDVMVWQAQPDSWTGTGVSRQMRECQKGATAAVRNMQDNNALSAGPQIVIDRSKLVPANSIWELTPRKIWYTKEGEEAGNVRDAFQVISIETRQNELMNTITFWLKEAEDVTGLPMLLQGQQGSAPDTVGGMQIMNNNGSTVLRRIARTYDDRITEPHIGRYYEWMLLYGPDDAKGDFTIDARGSSALVERDGQAQQIVQMLGMSLNPAYGLDPALVMQDFLKVMRFDPKNLLLSDEKKQEMDSQPPPEDPRIAAAKIAAAAGIQKVQAQGQVDIQVLAAEVQAEMQSDGGMTQASARIEQERVKAQSAERVADAQAQADIARANKDTLIAQQNGDYRMRELELKREIALLEYSNAQRLSLDTAKTQLAKAQMDNQTKRDLAAAEIQLAQSERADDKNSLIRDEVSTPVTP